MKIIELRQLQLNVTTIFSVCLTNNKNNNNYNK